MLARRSALLVVCALAALLAGCGGSSDDGGQADEQRVRAAVESLYASIRAGDPAAVCSKLTRAGQAQVAAGGVGASAGSCEKAFRAFLDAARKAGGLKLTLRARVRSVEVRGDRAVAQVSFGQGISGPVPLERIDGQWKLASTSPAP